MPRTKKIKVTIEPLPEGAHHKMGSWDNAKRWYPHDKYYNIPGAFNVRSPSRAWPGSYIKHLYSKKFARLLARHRPLDYIKAQDMDQESLEAKAIIAQHVELRIKGELEA